jgi:hypothetical protein
MMERPSLESASRPALPELVTEVLGNLAFMVTDDHDARPPSEIAWLACEVNYYGPHAGALRCWCTRPFATALAANLLGIEADQEDARAAAEDALREFMNVLCGQLVTAWYGTTPRTNSRSGRPGMPGTAAFVRSGTRTSIGSQLTMNHSSACMSRRKRCNRAAPRENGSTP